MLVSWTANNRYSLFHNNKILNILIKLIFNKLRKNILYKKTDIFWCYGKFCADYLINEFNVKRKKIFTGLQGFPKNQIKFDTKEIDYHKRYNSRSIVFIGYPSKRKNLKLISKTLLKYKHLNFSLFCIGPLPEKKLKNVTYLGYMDSFKKFKELNSFSFAILPSFSEPWGWVVNECMSIGLPILVSEGVMAKEMIVEPKLIFSLKKGGLMDSLNFINDLAYEKYISISNDCILSAQNHTLIKTKKSFENILNYVD